MANIKYYRPIQYLGAKTRSVERIVEESVNLYKKGTYVIDLFSGSSIISQALNSNGENVVANDVMAFCADIATCMLNVHRKDFSDKEIKDYVSFVLSSKLPEKYTCPFYKWIEKEEDYLKNRTLLDLQHLYRDLPQVWKNEFDYEQKNYISRHLGDSAIQSVPLISNYYAGTYFGIKQAIEMDNIRNAIEILYRENHDSWVKSLLLTALYNVMSIIVHSVGKHYAQPISFADTNPNKITNQRLFNDRLFDVSSLFSECVNVIMARCNSNATSNNFVSNADVTEASYLASLKEIPVSVVYADPPYTAQQYSRFYHIPEVIHSYKYPSLQVFRGNVTNGLYPEQKYKSPFCSKTQAYNSFECIFRVAKEKNASLILSYSESKKANTGNERMISMSNIQEIGKRHLPHHVLRITDFGFDYRQLNNKGKVVEEKEDKEVLLIFEKR